ncbi:MAG: hybrid sensor histidine kinase/response regulator [Crocinitomicaceae bacterium]|jgi:signal transduction histidine kinase|nr:hybrid sensor histidine kinase/response regulator [Crocinitomicaceae bacterium]
MDNIEIMNKKPKILIVDDRPENLLALKVVLKDLEIELVEASSGNEALKATLHHDFALALLDIQMPDMDGFELAGILREEEKTMHLPFIFISAVYTDNLNVFKGYEKGAFSFITKPFQPEILINKVKFFIEKYQQEITLSELNKDLVSKNNELADSLDREKQLNIMKSAFVSMASHEFRTPLTTILSSIALVEKYSGDEEQDKREKHFHRIKYSVRTLIDILDDFLSIEKLEQGKMETDATSFNLQEFLKEIAEGLNELCKEEQEIRFSYSGEEQVLLDKKIMRNVMFNLLSNAIKYSGKDIDFTVEVNPGKIKVTVRDQGIGIPEEQQQEMFGKFFRASNASGVQGTGLGLNIVKHYVDLMGGTISFDSKEGVGTTFILELPDHSRKTKNPEARNEAEI